MKLKYIPSIFRTYKICSAMVEKNFRNIDYVPDRHLDERIMERALAGSYRALYEISESKKTRYIIDSEEKALLSALEDDSRASDYAPEYLKTGKVAIKKRAVELNRKQCIVVISQPSLPLEYVGTYDLETAEELIKEGK